MKTPLAVRMRPQTIDEIVGQKDILDENSLLTQMIKNDLLSSIILYGPPGTGKTTIANVIANSTNAKFAQVNAVTDGKKELEKICMQGKKDLENDGTRTILFIDEIHRFNKAQQDYLLPFVEQGIVVLIGATTENPYFEVNKALVSRSTIFELKPVTAEDMIICLNRTLNDAERGLKENNLVIDDDTKMFIAEQANGDVRRALSLLELSAVVVGDGGTITVDTVKSIIQKPNLTYDKDGDKHYDTISAFIKSMRGSDPDAVLYYLARMITAGEDPKFIARRIMIAASEDVGNADPMAIVVATNAALAAERIGWPESQIILSQAALYVAMAPKSNSACTGIEKAMAYVADHPSNDVPTHLQDAHYKSAAKLGHGIGYKYPHDFPNHWCEQNYLPDSVTEYFYQNSHQGYEAIQANYQNSIRNSDS
jgi:putative ATPase